MEETRNEDLELPLHEIDRYPNPEDVWANMVEHPDFPTGNIERVEITGLANGEATWRVWPARAEEPVGGHFTEV